MNPSLRVRSRQHIHVTCIIWWSHHQSAFAAKRKKGVFYHSKAMMPWPSVYSSQKISFKQSTHSFSGWRVKAVFFSNRKVFLTLSIVFLPFHRATGKKNPYIIVTYYQIFHLWSCDPYFLPYWQQLCIWPKSLNITGHHFVQFLFVFCIKDMLVSNKS